MRRKRLNVENEDTDRWLVSYADFITLLFAFFVVMYGVSSVNIGKYRVVSDSLDDAFNEPRRSLKPVQIGNIARSPIVFTGYDDNAKGDMAYTLDAIYESLKMGFLDKNMTDDFVVTEHDNNIEIEIKSNLLFKSSGSELTDKSQRILKGLAVLLRPYPNLIKVEGFTDNVPIDNIFYPSNWDLSVARAASVVRALANNGVAGEQLSAVGYGEYQPIADNNTVAGRLKNRRVKVVILNEHITNIVSKSNKVLPDVGTSSAALITSSAAKLKKAFVGPRRPSNPNNHLFKKQSLKGGGYRLIINDAATASMGTK